MRAPADWPEPAAFRRLMHCRVLPTPTADTVRGSSAGGTVSLKLERELLETSKWAKNVFRVSGRSDSLAVFLGMVLMPFMSLNLQRLFHLYSFNSCHQIPPGASCSFRRFQPRFLDGWWSSWWLWHHQCICPYNAKKLMLAPPTPPPPPPSLVTASLKICQLVQLCQTMALCFFTTVHAVRYFNLRIQNFHNPECKIGSDRESMDGGFIPMWCTFTLFMYLINCFLNFALIYS